MAAGIAIALWLLLKGQQGADLSGSVLTRAIIVIPLLLWWGIVTVRKHEKVVEIKE